MVFIQPELLDLSRGQAGAVEVGEAQIETHPLPRPDREADVPRSRVQMERVRVRDEERFEDEWEATCATLPKAPTVSLVEREGGVGRRASMAEVNSEFPSEALSEGYEGAASGEMLFESLTDAEVYDEAEVTKKRVQRGRDWPGVAADEPPMGEHPAG